MNFFTNIIPFKMLFPSGVIVRQYYKVIHSTCEAMSLNDRSETSKKSMIQQAWYKDLNFEKKKDKTTTCKKMVNNRLKAESNAPAMFEP